MRVGGSRSGPRAGIETAWERLVAPAATVTGVGDRLRARFLAGLLLVVVVLGLSSGIVQLAVVPGFESTFRIMCVALTVLAGAYGLSRTRHFRVAGAFASLAPLVACAAVAIATPEDRAWWAFASLSVLFSSVFLPFGATVLVALAGLGAICALAALVPVLREPGHLMPALAFHGIFSPLMLLAAKHRDRLEAARAQARDTDQ